MTQRTSAHPSATGPVRPTAVGALLLSALVLTGCGGAPAENDVPAGPAPTTVTSAGPVRCPTPATATVHTVGELTTALAAAKPGSVIEVAAGTYQGHFTGTGAGDTTAPVILCGTRAAVLDGGDGGYTLHLDNTAFWQVVGLTVRGGQKGVVLDRGQHNTISGLEIEDTEQEGLHLRTNSSDNVVTGNLIHDTGQDDAKFGEGIYIGSAQSNWARYTGGEPDRSDHNLVADNSVSATTAEAVDIKEGTTGGILRSNKFTGPMSAANSWVNVKGNGWQIIDNIGHNSNGDGFSVHEILSGWGLDNTFSGNTAVVDGPGYGINVTKNKDRNTVSCSNREQGAAKGLTNSTCTR